MPLPTASVDCGAVTVTPVAASYGTVKSTYPVLPLPVVAVMRAVPGTMAVTYPLAETVMTLLFDEDHVTV